MSFILFAGAAMATTHTHNRPDRVADAADCFSRGTVTAVTAHQREAGLVWTIDLVEADASCGTGVAGPTGLYHLCVVVDPNDVHTSETREDDNVVISQIANMQVDP